MSSVPWVPENQLTEWQADSSRCTFTIAIDISKAHRPIEFLKSTKKNIRKKNGIMSRSDVQSASFRWFYREKKVKQIAFGFWIELRVPYFLNMERSHCAWLKIQLYKHVYTVIFNRVFLKSLHMSCLRNNAYFSNLPFLQELIRVEWSHWP